MTPLKTNNSSFLLTILREILSSIIMSRKRCKRWILKIKLSFFTRTFRCDLNQIPYDYSVEMTNRLKELDLVDTTSEELWTDVPNIVQEVVTKTILKKNKWKKAKWLSDKALQIAEKEEKQKARNKGKDIPSKLQRSRE